MGNMILMCGNAKYLEEQTVCLRAGVYKLMGISDYFQKQCVSLQNLGGS